MRRGRSLRKLSPQPLQQELSGLALPPRALTPRLHPKAPSLCLREHRTRQVFTSVCWTTRACKCMPNMSPCVCVRVHDGVRVSMCTWVC